jgi:hypothetical protein
VAIDWSLDLFFPKDIVLLKALLKEKPPGEGNGDCDEMGASKMPGVISQE